MATTLQLTEKEFPETFEKLNRLFEPIEQSEDNKQSFRDFCSKLLRYACDSKLNIRADADSPSEADSVSQPASQSQDNSEAKNE